MDRLNQALGINKKVPESIQESRSTGGGGFGCHNEFSDEIGRVMANMQYLLFCRAALLYRTRKDANLHSGSYLLIRDHGTAKTLRHIIRFQRALAELKEEKKYTYSLSSAIRIGFPSLRWEKSLIAFLEYPKHVLGSMNANLLPAGQYYILTDFRQLPWAMMRCRFERKEFADSGENCERI